MNASPAGVTVFPPTQEHRVPLHPRSRSEGDMFPEEGAISGRKTRPITIQPNGNLANAPGHLPWDIKGRQASSAPSSAGNSPPTRSCIPDSVAENVTNCLRRLNPTPPPQQISSSPLLTKQVRLSPRMLYKANEEATCLYLESIKDQSNFLADFCQRLPKTDLHKHMEGSIWAEHFLAFAAKQKDLVINTDTYMFTRGSAQGQAHVTPSTHINSSIIEIYRSRISLRKDGTTAPDGYARFFEACRYVENVRSFMSQTQQLFPVVRNALFQSVMYQELMIEIPHKAEFPSKYKSNFRMKDLPAAMKMLELWVAKYVEAYKSELSTSCLEVAELLKKDSETTHKDFSNIDDVEQANDPSSPAADETKQYDPISSLDSQLPTRFRVQVMRTLDNAEFFAECLGAMTLQFYDPTVVCLGIVGPEHDKHATDHFDDQLKILDFLYNKLIALYSKPDSPFKPNISMHAGELTKANSSPEVMRGRIKKSIEMGHATSIGHGVSLNEEGNMFGLLELMKSRGILLETCFSSNDLLLNVSGEQHPFKTYLKYGVPCTICEDDGGVLRIHITDEYVRAVREHKVNYTALKRILRNGINFSYLRGESIWIDQAYEKLRPEFEDLYDPDWKPGPDAEKFMIKSEKAKMQVRQERIILDLEAQWADLWKRGQKIESENKIPPSSE